MNFKHIKKAKNIRYYEDHITDKRGHEAVQISVSEHELPDKSFNDNTCNETDQCHDIITRGIGSEDKQAGKKQEHRKYAHANMQKEQYPMIYILFKAEKFG